MMPRSFTPLFERDYLSFAGAEALARTIDSYWHTRGHLNVTARVELLDDERLRARMGGSVYVVRSNLVAGKPPRIT